MVEPFVNQSALFHDGEGIHWRIGRIRWRILILRRGRVPREIH